MILENFQGEEREGFYIQPMMKRAWAVQMDILAEVDRICRRHHIRYWGWYGTLLGAVRHHGFIPWDDDMDLAMLRHDYESFQIYAQTELPEGWKLYKVGPALFRVINSDKIRIDHDFLRKNHGCPYIVGIDIFCLDRIPYEEEKIQTFAGLFWAVCGLCEKWDLADGDEYWQGESRWGPVEDLEKLTGYYFDRRGSMKDQLSDLADRIAAMYWESDYEEVSFVPQLYEEPHYRIHKFCFDRTIEVPFEHMTIPILEDYDLICRLSYGDDYMTPLRDYCHTYPFYKDQVEKLRNHFIKQGEILPEVFET